MKMIIIYMLMGCIAVATASGLDEETKDRLIDIYNLTADLYSIIVELLSDLGNGNITADRAASKVDEWRARYDRDTEPLPREAEKMRDLMGEMLYTARETARDYQPLNQRTKDMLKKMEEVKEELKKEMAELKYTLR